MVTLYDADRAIFLISELQFLFCDVDYILSSVLRVENFIGDVPSHTHFHLQLLSLPF